MSEMAEIETGGGESVEVDAPRDFEAEARQHGWTPKEDFRGDPNKWVDAEAFAKRADEVMPFLKKKSEAQDRELKDLKRQLRKATEFFANAEKRGYERAMTELEKRHEEAVEQGDNTASRQIRKQMNELAETAREVPEIADDKPAFDPVQARKELAEWVDRNDWYVNDQAKRQYADIQAEAMGPATEWPDGNQAWLDELSKRVGRKFADPKPSAANPGGNRAGARSGAKSFGDLPPEAQRACDKWVKQGIIADRKAYLANYDWS